MSNWKKNKKNNARFDTCPENHQAVQVISERISRVTDLAHKFDCSLGNHVDSYMDTLEESVADMEEIDVEVRHRITL